MRNVKFITERGLVGELNFEPTDPWGGFGDILTEAASMMKQDTESDWVIAEERGFEVKVFRDFFKSRGML